MNRECIVLFPVYRPLYIGERSAVSRALEMTAGFECRFVAPESLVYDDTFSGFEHIETERFPDEFFRGIQGYNKLMLDPGFYERFRDFKYILICQTDAYLFKPELQEWCDRGYDYIGAPWFKEKKLPRFGFWQFMLRNFGPVARYKAILKQVRHNNVGNGGLSLRKVDSFLRILEIAPPRLLARFRNDPSIIRNEDVFWGVLAPRISKDFQTPRWREAMRFAVEWSPSRSHEIMGGAPPFGCHAFRKIEPEFWKKHIPSECFHESK